MSNISQDRRQEPQELQLSSGNTIIYVEYIGNAFQWGLTQASMVSLSTTIITTSNSAVTYEFVSTGAGTIYYKLPPSAPNGTVLPPSNGPTVVAGTGDILTGDFNDDGKPDYFINDFGKDAEPFPGGAHSSRRPPPFPVPECRASRPQARGSWRSKRR